MPILTITFLFSTLCMIPVVRVPFFSRNSFNILFLSASLILWVITCFADWAAIRPNCSGVTSILTSSSTSTSSSISLASSKEICVSGSSTSSTTVFVLNTPISPVCSSKIASILAASLTCICFLYAATIASHKEAINTSLDIPRSLSSSSQASNSAVPILIIIYSPFYM